MKPIDRILVAVSLSEGTSPVIGKAAALAAQRDAALTLLHVVEPAKPLRVRLLAEQRALVHARVTHAGRLLAKLAGEIAGRHGIPVAIDVCIGGRVEAIVDACAHADVLFVGRGETGGISGLLQRSTAERLLGRCPVPMLVVHGHDGRQGTRVLLPVRVAPNAMDVVDLAGRLWPGAQKIVFHAMDDREDRLRQLGNVPAWSVRKGRRARLVRIFRSLDRLLSAGQGSPATNIDCMVGYGDAWKAVLHAQEALDADLIVVTETRPLLLSSRVLGGTVRRLLRAAQCDLLVCPSARADEPVRHVGATERWAAG